MKDKILKLCRRMGNATKTDLLQIAEIEPNVLETVLMYLLDEKLLEEKNGCYFPILGNFWSFSGSFSIT